MKNPKDFNGKNRDFASFQKFLLQYLSEQQLPDIESMYVADFFMWSSALDHRNSLFF
jgi:hypothetical protein